MKTKQELLSMLFARLAELKDGRIKTNITAVEKLRVELALLYAILGDDIPEEYLCHIEEVV